MVTKEFYFFENISFVHSDGRFVLKKRPSLITFTIGILAIPIAIWVMKSLTILFFFLPIIIYVLFSTQNVSIHASTGEIVFQKKWLFVGGKKKTITTSIPMIVKIGKFKVNEGSGGIRTYYAVCLVSDLEHEHPLLVYESLSTDKYLRKNLSRLSNGILQLDNAALNSDQN